MLRIAILTVVLLTASHTNAQDLELYYKNFVRHADGTPCRHAGSESSFRVFLNGDAERVLFDNAPRWEEGGDPNIAGNGTFGVQLGNFESLAPSDTVVVEFICFATGQQGRLERVAGELADQLPATLTLQETEIPAAPRDLSLRFTPEGRVLEWSPEDGTEYAVYRRSSHDTLDTGIPRMLYHRIGAVDVSAFVDSNPESGAYGYVIVPRRDGVWGARSAEATNIPIAPENVRAWVDRLQPPAVRVVWNSAGHFEDTRYRIYRTSSIDPQEYVLTADASYVVDDTVEPGRIYTYRVRTDNPGQPLSDASEAAEVQVRVPEVADGFTIEMYADGGLDHPSGMAFGPDGRLYVSEVSSGEIKSIRYVPGGTPEVSVFADGFNMPVGLAWKGDSLYVSSRGTITILRDDDGDGSADFYDPIIEGWEANWHQNNQIVFDDAGYFYVALGAWEDRTTGPSPYHNAILRISPDGLQVQVWAKGIRNVYDLAIGPEGRLFGGDNGWQDPTAGPPVEELNIYEKGGDYGFPDYLGKTLEGSGTVDPIVTFPPHTSPTGIAFMKGSQLPSEYHGDLLLAFYGPDFWTPSYLDRAYRIVRAELDGTVVTDTSTFASNFYRPVDILVDPAGTVLVADLGGLGATGVSGRIYQISSNSPGPSSRHSEVPDDGPLRFSNFPNPFSGQTIIRGRLRKSGVIRIEIVDLLGRVMATLVQTRMGPGDLEVVWNGRDGSGRQVANGIYIYRIVRDGEVIATERMIAVR